MTPERYKAVDDGSPLTPEEIKDGWHFCWEWDGLLVGPGMGELQHCDCLRPGHPAYKIKPPEEPFNPIPFPPF